MDRYTRKDAEKALQRLADATGHRLAESWNDVGGWELDYNPTYGGCVINEISNEGGAVSQPFGCQRHSPREFCDMVRFGIHALRQTFEGADI